MKNYLFFPQLFIIDENRLFACLVMASKVWDDLSMWNVDFSQVCPSFDLQRVNALELAMLDALKYVVRVSSSEYAKYYFHLRSMMARLGFSVGAGPNAIEPLNLNGARKLQLATERYEQNNRSRQDSISGGLHGDTSNECIRRNHSFDETYCLLPHQHPVGLEQVVHMEHVDADGGKHKGIRRSDSGTLIQPDNSVIAGCDSRRRYDSNYINQPPVTRSRSEASSYFRSVGLAATMPTPMQAKEDFKSLTASFALHK